MRGGVGRVREPPELASFPNVSTTLPSYVFLLVFSSCVFSLAVTGGVGRVWVLDSPSERQRW